MKTLILIMLLSSTAKADCVAKVNQLASDILQEKQTSKSLTKVLGCTMKSDHNHFRAWVKEGETIRKLKGIKKTQHKRWFIATYLPIDNAVQLKGIPVVKEYLDFMGEL